MATYSYKLNYTLGVLLCFCLSKEHFHRYSYGICWSWDDLVNLSLLLVTILFWRIMWPLIAWLKGEWFPATLPESSMKSLNGYKEMDFITSSRYSFSLEEASTLDSPKLIASTHLIWYFVLAAYLLAPSLSFCNAYGAGLTDMNMAYNYGKAELFVMAALAGKSDELVAGMVACGLIKLIVSVSADLMHDFKIGHLTLTSPRSMLVAQAIGTTIGCVVAPLTSFLFYKASDVGNPPGW
ncbi:unnamed protein product [Arabis nemorensis]|uniref:Uncharacterized protein n=1 Tax=Arabis nemorensis TaxID=586526 RepID=A0A565CS74_9BRAS|nr:unnamed protein product [Arabis nemorensis]